MLTPEETEIINEVAEREGKESAEVLAKALEVRRQVAERANLSEDEAMELAVAEQHAMRAERRAAKARSVKAG